MPHYEKGTYRATVKSQRFGQTPNGSDYLAIEFEPTSALGVNTFPEEVYKRELTLYFTEKAAQFSIDKLRRMGWNGTKLFNLDPSSPNYESLEGAVINVVCRHSDKGYEDWDLTAPGGGGTAAAPSDAAIANRLDKLFGKALKTTVPKSSPKPAVKETVPPTDDDEVPF